MSSAKTAENDAELRGYLEGVLCELGGAIGSRGLSDCGLLTALCTRRGIAQRLLTAWPDEDRADPDRTRRVAEELQTTVASW